MSVTSSRDLVPVAPLREAFLASGMTTYSVAQQLGWMRDDGKPKPDTTRVRRALGLTHFRGGKSKSRYYCTRIGYDRALAIAEIIGVDPVEVGL